MQPLHISKANFSAIEFNGEYALLTEQRIDKNTVPEGLYAYDLRHGDDFSKAGTIERSVIVNFFGTILFDHSIEIPDCGYLTIDGYEEINYLGYDASPEDSWEAMAEQDESFEQTI